MRRNPVLTVGEVYTNRNGSAYRCTSISGPGRAILERVTDRWTLLTHGITVYEDGTIEWDYGVNILNLNRVGGVWELETVSAPFVKHSHKIVVKHPKVSGEVEVQKVVSTTNDSGFIRTYIYF